jgi:hypothetical protein
MRSKRSSLAVVVILAHEQPESGNPRHPEEKTALSVFGQARAIMKAGGMPRRASASRSKPRSRHGNPANTIMRDAGLHKAF